ncbi:MAG TPA: RluA family pseudouridine synthase [Kofleriaceae bacterium]|nr:RluA family pseudouridine synthase [Kofleriaceae bacterium]
MDAIVTYLDPPPAAHDVPARMPSPFAPGPPCALARRAAERLQAEVDHAAFRLDAPDGGKMFGVLVVEDAAGRVGFLRGFSGMVNGRWDLPGFVPPAFDQAARDAFWVAGEAELVAIAKRIAEIDERIGPLRARLAEIASQFETEGQAMRERHRGAREVRHAARAAGADRAALDRESRMHTAEKRSHDLAYRAAREPIETQLAELDAERRRLDDDRAARSRDYLVRIHDTYTLPNARGEVRKLRELFDPARQRSPASLNLRPAEPPGGAGDCAAPKLLAHAYRHGLRPIALAEVWLGAPPATGGRIAGVYYPACRGKCGPILAHMLQGLDVEAAPVFGGGPIADDQPRTMYEDRWLVIVDKPVGLLSVPGRGGALRDSVLARLRARYPEATGPVLVHRLDLDTSGLLVAAKDAQTHRELQRLFAIREVEKRYIAWLEGEVAGDVGTIDLALRVDLDDRPRQIVDPQHGKAAVTDWQVLARQGGRTRVALSPRTGRAHQLRVHAAVGLGAPIVGDRLYGRPGAADGERLLLHAEAIAFVHPHTGERVAVTRSAPF